MYVYIHTLSHVNISIVCEYIHICVYTYMWWYKYSVCMHMCVEGETQ